MATPPPPGAGPGSRAATETAERAKLYTERHVPSFSDQCILLEMADAIRGLGGLTAGPGNSVGGKPVPVRQINIPPAAKPFGSIQEYETNLDYIQHITRLKSKYFKKYFQFTPDEIARISHYITIKERLDSRDPSQRRSTTTTIFGERSQKEFAINGLLSSRSRRLGAGIKSVNVDFDGVDSFTKKQVVVSATFIFQDIKEMMSDRYGKLFTLETDRETTQGNKLRTIEFKLGWRSEDKNLKAAVANLDLTIRATLFKYDFDVRQDGSIVANATYRGQYVDTFNGPGSNVLEIAKNRYKQIKDQLKEIEKTKGEIISRSSRNAREAQQEIAILDFYINALDETLGEIDSGKIIIRKGRADTTIILSTSVATPYAGQQFRKEVREIALKRLERQYTAAGYTASAVRTTRTKAYRIYGAIGRTAGDPAGGMLLREYSEELKKQTLHKKNLITTNRTNATDAGTFAAKYAADAQLRKANLGKLLALQIIGEGLISEDKVKYAVIDRETVKQFKLASALGDKGAVTSTVDDLLSRSADIIKTNRADYEAIISKEAIDNVKYQVVPFILFGEFVESILRIPVDFTEDASGKIIPNKKEIVYDLMKKEGSDFRVDLGLVSYDGPFTGSRIHDLPLYYLPISLLEINNFFVREVIAKGKSFYSFNDLILDVVKKFLTGVFSSCTKEANAQSFSPPKIATVIGEQKEKKKKVTQFFIYGAKNVVNDLASKGLNKKNKFGKYSSNINAAVPHFFLFGTDKGIEKNIKLRDNADDTLKTAVYYSPRSSLVNELDGAKSMKQTGFIPAVFTADVTTIGFPLMSLGQLIYIDLKSQLTAKKEATRPFKASGYYNIHKVSHNFTVDTFSTTISAIIQVPYVNRKNLSIDNTAKARSLGGYKKAVTAAIGGSSGATLADTLAKVRGTKPSVKVTVSFAGSDFQVIPQLSRGGNSSILAGDIDNALESFKSAISSTPKNFSSVPLQFRPDPTKTIKANHAVKGSTLAVLNDANILASPPYAALDPQLQQVLIADLRKTEKAGKVLLKQRLYYIYIYEDNSADVLVEHLYN
tara:strand:- start:1550 stop:4714 length:3165 start_codon:yes stop_codon:yes gene_type:complete